MARPRRSQKTRLKLLDVGVALFIQKGYHATGLKELTDRVGLPKGSFYNHFKSKEHFGAEVMTHWGRQTWSYLDFWLGGSSRDALNTLDVFFDNEIQRLKDEKFVGCLCGNFAAELGDKKQLIQEATIVGMKGMHERFAQLIKRGQGEGSIRQDISADKLAVFILDAYEGAILRMKVEGSTAPIKSFRSHVIDRYLRAAPFS